MLDHVLDRLDQLFMDWTELAVERGRGVSSQPSREIVSVFLTTLGILDGIVETAYVSVPLSVVSDTISLVLPPGFFIFMWHMMRSSQPRSIWVE